MNEQDVIRKAMAILGSRTSAAKKRSSRLNGMKRAKSGKGRKINVKRKVAQANR